MLFGVGPGALRAFAGHATEFFVLEFEGARTRPDS